VRYFRTTGVIFATILLFALAAAGPAAAKTKPKPHSSGPTIGSTQRVLNQAKQYEAIRLIAIFDPAQPANSFLGPNPGMKYVAVEIQITNQSKGTDAGDANNNLSVIGSNKQGYQADFDDVSECTNFNGGQYTLPKGGSEQGCVVYQMPTSVTVSKVQYNPNSGFSTNNAFWTIPKGKG
jgi:hypothetical protein